LKKEGAIALQESQGVPYVFPNFPIILGRSPQGRWAIGGAIGGWWVVGVGRWALLPTGYKMQKLDLK